MATPWLLIVFWAHLNSLFFFVVVAIIVKFVFQFSGLCHSLGNGVNEGRDKAVCN